MRRRHASLASQGNPLCCYILGSGVIYIFSMFVVDHLFACIPPPMETFFFVSVLCTAGVVPSSSIIVFHLKHTHTRLHRTGRVKLRPCRAPPPYTYDMMAYTTFFSFLLYDLLASSILDLFFFSFYRWKVISYTPDSALTSIHANRNDCSAGELGGTLDDYIDEEAQVE